MAKNVLALLVISTTIAAAVHEDTLKELRCVDPSPVPDRVDLDWVQKVGAWHMNGGSQLHLHRVVAELSGILVSDVRPHDLFYHSCPRFHLGAKGVLKGFGEKEADTKVTPNEDGTSGFRLDGLSLDGVSTPVLTDNKTFIMLYICWSDEQEASWVVISTGPVLKSKARDQVHAKAKALGFDEGQFTKLLFQSCGANEDENEDVKDEL